MNQGNAIIIGSCVPTVAQIIATIIHYFWERHTRMVAEQAAITAQKISKQVNDVKIVVGEVKTIVQNGGTT